MSAHSMNSCNHDLPVDNAAMVNVQVDGKWVQVPNGLNVIEALKTIGKFLPHYCYHPKLEVAGNCRMCLFEMGTPKMDSDKKMILGKDGKPEISWLPKPQIACGTKVSDGMGIRTESKMVKESQKGILEFLLLNHPLDCPICDKAGECLLQEFSVEFGTATSRLIEKKEKKPKCVDLGERIVLDDERCILCSRCIRFSKDVLQDNVLGFVKRGAHVMLTTHPKKKFDNEYSLNTVDICPVGALTSKDFRFQMRVWFLKETKSICASCGTGCNVTIGSRENKVYRLTPRANEAVNSHWMCDYGRLNIHDLDSEKRFRHPLMAVGEKMMPRTWAEVYTDIGKRIRDFSNREIAIVASAKMTNEELFSLKQWATDLKAAHLDVAPHEWKGDEFLKCADKNPNSNGARVLEVSQDGKKLPVIREDIRNGKIRALFIFHEDICEAGIEEEDLKKLGLLVFVGLLPNRTTQHSHFILPASGFAEKYGSMINAKGRLQKLRAAVLPPEGALCDWEILRDLKYVTVQNSSEIEDGPCEREGAWVTSAIDEIFREMSLKHHVFRGLTLDKIGDEGVQAL